jgi:uncharacterized membrane protein
MVMVLMALDHVRVYSAIPAGGPTPGVFFTRWVTHFVAPAFIFLAGTSAWLYGRSHQDLRRFLVTRGLWLVLLELTVIRFFWTFNLDYGTYALAGVIWVIGWCLVLLSLLVSLPAAVVGALAGPVELGGGRNLWVLYSIVPWIGVVAAGYGFGRVMAMEPAAQQAVCLRLGLGAGALFLVLRGFNLYGDPRPWSRATDGESMPGLLSFLNATKYPASLSFLLMTLGPTIAVLPLVENLPGRVATWLETFGGCPSSTTCCTYHSFTSSPSACRWHGRAK